jgi:hypothetical protein
MSDEPDPTVVPFKLKRKVKLHPNARLFGDLRRDTVRKMAKAGRRMKFLPTREMQQEYFCVFMLGVFNRETWLPYGQWGPPSSNNRPVKYNFALANELVRRMVEMGRTLTQICSEDEDMPTRHTVYRWMQEYPDLHEKVEEARRFLAYHREDEIADEIDLTNMGNHQAQAVKIKAMQWRAEKSNPKGYGHKAMVQADINGNLASSGMITQLDVSSLTNEELDALESALRKTVFGQLEGPYSEMKTIEVVKADGGSEAKEKDDGNDSP